MRNKKFLLLTMMLAMTVGTTACSNKEQENVSDTASQVTANEANEEVSDVEITEEITEETTTKSEVIVAVNSEPSSGWDPITGYGQRFDPVIQSTLTKAYGGEITNDLAVDYTVSDDGMDWTFDIRPDACYSNGESVTASDVAFTYESVRDGSTSLDLSNIKDAEAVDDDTVVFHLNQPDYTFLYVTYKVGIVPEKYYDENYGENPIGSGPFKITA